MNLPKKSFYIYLTLLVGFLVACGGETSPSLKAGDLPVVAGSWEDNEAVLELCGNQGMLGIALDLKQSEGRADVSGSGSLHLSSSLLSGTFSGRVDAKGSVAGKLSLSDSQGTLVLETSLSYADGALTGHLSDTETLRCDNGSKSRIVIRVNLKAAPDDELEPNDSSEQASEITSGFAEDLILQDPDWFTFTLSGAQLVEIAMKVPDNDIYTAGASLYNAELAPLGGIDLGTGSRQYELAAGTYYLEIAGTIETEGHGYSLSLVATPLPDAALEPNNNKEAASDISLDFAGEMFMGSEDQDWFTFELKEKQSLRFDLGEAGSHLKTDLYRGEVEVFTTYYGTDEPIDLALEPGRYYLGISLFNGKQRSYTLKVGSANVSDRDNEPNNDATQATPLTLGELYEGYLVLRDEDWFSFELSGSSSVRFKVEVSNTSLNPVALFDKDLNEVTLGYDDGDYLSTLAPDRYYIKLVGPHALGDQDVTYSLLVEAELVPDAALEPNDSFATASAITLASAPTLHLSGGDEDWFKLIFTDDRVLSFDTSEVSAIFTRELYNAGQNLLLTAQNEGGKRYALPAGTYYLRVLPQYGSAEGFTYTLETTQQTPPDATHEPNNSFAQATLVEADSETCGILTENDRDYYTFELKEARVVTGYTSAKYLNAEGHPFADSFLSDDSFTDLTDMWLMPHGFQALLNPGRYYVEPLVHFLNGGVEYCSHLRTSAPPADPYEPDNSVEEATSLSLPFSKSKLFLAENRVSTGNGIYDADWFTFDLETRSLVSAVLALNLYQSQTITATLIGPEGFSQVISSSYDGILEPGTYYLKVAGTYNYPSGDFGKTYGLELSASPVP